VTPWAANTAYHVGDLVSYGGHSYRCIQAHTSQAGWEPPNVPALWSLVS
jgi:chitinase